jgi:hypothetical protein
MRGRGAAFDAREYDARRRSRHLEIDCVSPVRHPSAAARFFVIASVQFR